MIDETGFDPTAGVGGIFPLGGGDYSPVQGDNGNVAPVQGGSTIEQTDDLDKVIIAGDMPIYQIPQLFLPKITAEEFQQQYPDLVEFLKSIDVSAQDFLASSRVTEGLLLAMNEIVQDMWDHYSEVATEMAERTKEGWQNYIASMAGMQYDAFRDQINKVASQLFAFQMDQASLRTAEQVHVFNAEDRPVDSENIAVASLVAQVKFNFASPFFVEDLRNTALARIERETGKAYEDVSPAEQTERDRKAEVWAHSAKVQVLFNALGVVLQVPGIADASIAVEQVLTADHQHKDVELLRTMLSAELGELTALLGSEAATKMFYDLGSEMAYTPDPTGYIHAVSGFLAMVSGDDNPSTAPYHRV